MRRLTSVLVTGLVLAGCSTAEKKTPPPSAPPPPPASRALVGWAETTCTHVKQVDDLRGKLSELEQYLTPASGTDSYLAGTQAASYVRSAAISVESATTALKELPPSGIQAADAHVAGLLKALDGVRPQLPSINDTTLLRAPDEEKIAKARQVGQAIAAIEGQGPKLAALAEGTPQLTSSYNLAPSCSPVKQHDQRARTLLAWSNVMCDSTKALLGLDTDPSSNPALADPRFAQFAEIELAQYISSSARPVEQIAVQLSSAPSTGVKEADEYRTGILTAIQAALAKLPKDEPGSLRLGSQPLGQLKTRAAQVAKTLKSIKPKQPDLAKIAAANPELSTAYNLAPACEPPKAPSTSLPRAVDGTDVAACRSGKCQIQVNGSAEVAMSGFRFTIAVTPSGVNVAHDSGLLQLGSPGEGSFGNRSKTVKFKVLGLRGTTAVLDISTS